MPDPERVKQVLAWFAERPFRGRFGVNGRFGEDYRTVIDRASDAVADLEAAAEFVETRGLEGLEAAVETAEQAEDHAAARRGRRALETVQEFQRAAAGETGSESGEVSTVDEVEGTDHFHSGRGTTLGGGAQPEGK